jgi:hypothetical protein
MSKVASQALVVPGPCVSVPEGMRRAISELFAVRTGMEQAFDVVHASATAHALDNPRYLVAMQSIDTLSQQVAAVERFLLNLSTELSRAQRGFHDRQRPRRGRHHDRRRGCAPDGCGLGRRPGSGRLRLLLSAWKILPERWAAGMNP